MKAHCVPGDPEDTQIDYIETFSGLTGFFQALTGL